eukprot:g6766.t1
MSKSCSGLLRELVKCVIESDCFEEKGDVKLCLKVETCRGYREAYFTYGAEIEDRSTLIKNGNPIEDRSTSIKNDVEIDLDYLQSSDSEDEIVRFDGLSEIGELIREPSKQGATFEEIIETFPYKLDKFQSVSIRELLSGKSVVICAPTGAGKTVIADAAALACLSRGKKVIYTTPLKALSNQKLFEFRKRFGVRRTGLVTGDTSIRSNANITVMTTEILRNMLYDIESESGSLTQRLEEIGLIVLDEVHYLGVPDRGSVWEELIVGCPKHIQMLCMSATVANPQDLGDWISQIHGPCATIKTSRRPVPLSWHFAFSVPKMNYVEIHPLLNEDKTRLNPVCTYEMKPGGFETRLKRHEVKPSSRVPSLSGLIFSLRRRDYLPAIIFVFSRVDCDRNAIRMNEQGVSLTSPEERSAIERVIEEVRADQPEAIKEQCVGALIKGIATHHAGCLPAWKALVETLFQSGYLKVVFATGTLAAGINMPARTTVLCTLSRRMQETNVLIGHNELLQMAGRAGRRGFDTEGNCVILQSRYEGAREAFSILKSGTEPLASQLTTGYSFVLNLLARFSLNEAKSFLEKSFRSYLTGVGLTKREEQIKELTKQVELLQDEQSGGDGVTQDSEDQDDQYEVYTQARKEFTKLLKEARVERAALVSSKMKELETPFPVLLDSTKNALGNEKFTAMCLEHWKQFPSPPNATSVVTCLGSDNVFYKAPLRSIVGIISKTQSNSEQWNKALEFAKSKRSKWGVKSGKMQFTSGNKMTAKAAFTVPPDWQFESISWSAATDLNIKAQSSRTKKLKKAARSPSTEQEQQQQQSSEKTDKTLKRQLRKARRNLSTALRIKKEMESEKELDWAGFKSTMETLVMAGALNETTLDITPLGQVAREFYGDNELWMATVFTHSAVLLLSPPLLAALASAFVSPEVLSRPGIQIAMPPPEEIPVILEKLENSRRQLYEFEVTTGFVSQRAIRGLQIDARAAGLVDAWASGCSWTQLLQDTNLDDGDLARLLLRTGDILRQVTMSNYLLEPVRTAARKAQKSMNRKPIQDLFQ